MLRIITVEVKSVGKRKKKKKIVRKQSSVFECNPSQVQGIINNLFCKDDALSGTGGLPNLNLYLSTLLKRNSSNK